MPTTLGKNLHLCFTKLSRSPTDLHHSNPSPPPPLPANTNNNNNKISSSSSSSSSSTSSVLIKTFNTLYDLTPESSTSKSRSSDYFSSSDSDDESTPPPADFATVYASNRFFFSSPGRTNSIVEESLPESSSSSSPESESDTLINGGVAVPTYSPDPYMDFRRSMQEMVEARDMLLDVTADWDYLHELLLCYLSINPKNAHKFILGAFADLLVSLMTSSKSGHRKSDISGRCVKNQ